MTAKNTGVPGEARKEEVMGLTQEEAIALSKTEFWKDMSLRERAEFQLFEDRLCMPFDVFHEAIEKTLGRPVMTHEFAFIDQIRREFLGQKPSPTFQEILELIPADKRVVLVAPGLIPPEAG